MPATVLQTPLSYHEVSLSDHAPSYPPESGPVSENPSDQSLVEPALLRVLLRNFEAEICPAADSEQGEKRPGECRHRQPAPHRIDEESPKHDSPDEHLETMEAVTVLVGQYVAQ